MAKTNEIEKVLIFGSLCLQMHHLIIDKCLICLDPVWLGSDEALLSWYQKWGLTLTVVVVVVAVIAVFVVVVVVAGMTKSSKPIYSV
jgi:hypothetical protein